jgi:alpha-mannosidase
MINKKAEKRVDQILERIDDMKFLELTTDTLWYSAKTQNEYGDVPAGEELRWKAIDTFPHPYGEEWTNYWFRTALPSNLFSGLSEDLYLEIETETDGLMYINGRPESAINPNHELVKLTKFMREEEPLVVSVECWAGHEFPGYHPSQSPQIFTTVSKKHRGGYPLYFARPRILVKQGELYELYYDAYVLRELSKTLSPTSYHYMLIIDTLHKELMKLDFSEANPAKLVSVAREIRAGLLPLLNAKNGTISPEIYSVGNAHLDHAWLWTIDETIRKAARTASTMLNYVEEFEDFSFMFTQPAQMLSVKKRYPYVYARVLEAYEQGKWEPAGTSWIEPDCMLPSGESLIRQFLVGLKASRELYPGYKSDVFWIPDSFGYNGALPQILVGCGMKYFITSKIGWNETNRFPYELFLWEGIDGTRIPSQMIVGPYEGTNEPTEIFSMYDKIQNKEFQPRLMRSIGEGDGGGGTRLKDLEIMKRVQDIQGLPKNQWSTLENSMSEIFSPDCIKELPVYKGELYLELHRGTYTSQAQIKKNNKELEVLLHNAEFMAACLFWSCRKENELAQAREKIREAWKIVLTNQFHDILPGSCISKVAQEANSSYDRARSALNVAMEIMQSGSGTAKRYFNFNPTPVYSGADGSLVAPYSNAPLGEENTSLAVSIRGDEIITQWGTLRYDKRGGFSSIKLKNGRELVSSDSMFNTLTVGNDTTLNWDAWDIEYDTIPSRCAVNADQCHSIKVSEEQVVTIEQSFEVGEHSTAKQSISIFPHERKIDFSCVVEWHESHKILRVDFPATIASDAAQFSIPFGYLSRSTTENTSWDRACFESPALHFVSFGDAGTTLVLSSGSKYGYSVKSDVLSLSLLKSAKAPDPCADQGHHECNYSLYFEEGGSKGVQKAIQDGYETLNPAVPVSTESLWKLPIEMHSQRGEVLLETVKISEDNSGIIVRFYESLGTDSQVTIIPDEVYKIYETNMIEEVLSEVSFTMDEPIRFDFHPFQIRTFLCKRKIR